MALVTAEEATELTRPWYDLWAEAVAYAERYWWDLVRQDAPDLFNAAAGEPGTRATVLHALITSYVERKLTSRGVFTTRSRGFFVQPIMGQSAAVTVRFKLLDSAKLPQNQPSDQQLMVDHQEFEDSFAQELILMGMTGVPTWLTCGYQVSPAETGISELLLGCYHNRRAIYLINLHTLHQEIPLTLPGFEPPEPKIVSRRDRAESATE
jgi:hypothetical protein